MKTYFATNLRLLCNQQPSVAHVCRSIEINRQQFNKYLSGTVYPSRFNLEKICRFFEVDRDSLNLEEKEFEHQCKFNILGRQATSERQSDLNALVDSLPNSVELLERYIGYYYSHFHALGYPGYMVRSLVCVYTQGNRFYTKSIEHLWDKESGTKIRHRFKYQGLVLYLADRIFITEYETLGKQVVCHTILYPSYRSRIDFLSGVTTGVGSLNAHLPKSARVEYQFLGKTVDIKAAIRGCGLFKVDSSRITKEIRDRIVNEITVDEFMLIARGQ